MNTIVNKMNAALSDIKDHIESELLPFWLNKGIDREFGGYFTCFDENGTPTTDTNKYIVTQTWRPRESMESDLPYWTGYVGM